MDTIQKYFERAVQKAGSAAALARELNITQQAGSNYHLKHRIPDAQVARKIARYLGEKEEVLVMAAEAARTKDKDMKKFWENLGKSLATSAAVALMLGVALDHETGITLSQRQNTAENGHQSGHRTPNSLYYVKLVITLLASFRRFNSRWYARILAALTGERRTFRNSHSIVLVG